MNSFDKVFGQYAGLESTDAGRPDFVSAVNAAGLRRLHSIAASYRPDKNILAECRPDVVFAPDYGINAGHVDMTADVAASFRCGVPQLNSLLTVVSNDIVQPSAQPLPEGLTMCSLRDVPDAFTDDAAAMLADSGDSISAAIADTLTHDGVYIRVEAGVEVEKAVQIVNIFNSTLPLLTPRRVLVHACEGAKVRVLLCDHSQTPAMQHLNLQTVNVRADRGATVEFYDIEESSAATRRVFSFRAVQASDSTLVVNTSFLSGGVTDNDFNIFVPGDNATTRLSGLAIISGSQICSDRVLLRHLGTHCTSRQIFKNALFDNARGAFGGRIVVDEAALYTDASQTNRNILESPSARMEASPTLEIYCDEVKCSHGATTGSLDERALFYMQSRGIPRDEARRMLTQAFMVDVIDGISFEVLRQRLHVLVEKRLSGASADCNTCATACHTQKSE